MEAEFVAIVVGIGVIVLAALALIGFVCVQARTRARERQRALQESIRREQMRSTQPRPRIRAGTARADDWTYSGASRHFTTAKPPGHTPPRPESKSQAKRFDAQGDDSGPPRWRTSLEDSMDSNTAGWTTRFAGGGGMAGGAGSSGSWGDSSGSNGGSGSDSGSSSSSGSTD